MCIVHTVTLWRTELRSPAARTRETVRARRVRTCQDRRTDAHKASMDLLGKIMAPYHCLHSLYHHRLRISMTYESVGITVFSPVHIQFDICIGTPS